LEFGGSQAFIELSKISGLDDSASRSLPFSAGASSALNASPAAAHQGYARFSRNSRSPV
jgi:hypothetical protein